MSKWKQSLSFLSPQHVSVPINGNDVKFYAFPVNIAYKLKNLAKPLAEAFTHLQGQKKGDLSYSENMIQDKEGNVRRDVQTQAVAIEILKMRDDKKIEAIETLTNMIFGNEELIRDCICSSMREVFPDPKDYPSPNELFEFIGMDSVSSILKGVVEANRKILGPFSDSLIQMMNQKLDQLSNSWQMTANEDSQEVKQEAPQDLTKVE